MYKQVLLHCLYSEETLKCDDSQAKSGVVRSTLIQMSKMICGHFFAIDFKDNDACDHRSNLKLHII